MAENVAAILGIGLDMAENLLAAAGGDAALAIDLGLGSAGGNQDDTAVMPIMPQQQEVPDQNNPPLAYPEYARVWPQGTTSTSDMPSAWADQRLDAWKNDGDNDDEAQQHAGYLVQPRNGPCGVLAVLQAWLWLQPSQLSATEKLTRALEAILQRVAEHRPVTLRDGTSVTVPEAARRIRTAVDLVDAVARTTNQPFGRDGNTLVEGPHWLCSMELISLLLRGTVGHVRAYDDVTQKKVSFYNNNNNNNNGDENSHNRNPIGMLSFTELEQGVPLADDLKFDKKVWILHTGDHFVTMRQLTASRLEVYDGLPPNGPTSSFYDLTGDLSTASPATNVFVESFTKKRPGQPDDIVQARKTSSPSSYQDWTFEVVPAIDDPTVQGPLDDDPNEPVYTFAQPVDVSTPWRCASCYYTRFQTMCFGLNNDGGATCGTCHKPRSEAMWSLWQSYEELSPRMKQRARRMYAPRVELVLSTLWPRAAIALVKEAPSA